MEMSIEIMDKVFSIQESNAFALKLIAVFGRRTTFERPELSVEIGYVVEPALFRNYGNR